MNKNSISIRALIFIPVIVITGWALYGDYSLKVARYLGGLGQNAGIEKAGSWGDSFGALNALLSAAAFAIILATLIQQGRAIAAQSLDQHNQRFETSFFVLISLMRDLRSQIQFANSTEYMVRNYRYSVFSLGGASKNNDTSIDDPISAANREIHFWLAEKGLTKRASGDDYANIYMHRIHSKSEATISPYFRIVYTIINRVDSDEVLSQKDKIRYINIVRGQLTSSDTMLMAINALTPISADLSDMIIKFHLLKYLPSSSMEKNLRKIYPAAAFASRDPRSRKYKLNMKND